MNALLVIAHPSGDSFSHAMAGAAAAVLRARGCTCWVHDLYAEGFNPVQPTPESGNVASDDPLVELHCARLQAAELIAVFHPNWWSQPPAILKGWIDRVFTRKFAFDFGPGGMKGLLTHEKALILNTLGGDEASYREHRWHELLVRPMAEGILGACGVKNVSHRAFYQVPTVGQTERQGMLEEVRALAAAF